MGTWQIAELCHRSFHGFAHGVVVNACGRKDLLHLPGCGTVPWSSYLVRNTEGHAPVRNRRAKHNPMIWDDSGGIRVFKGVMNQQRVHCGGHLALGDGHQSIPNMAWDDPKQYRMEYHVLTQAIWSLAAIERGH